MMEIEKIDNLYRVTLTLRRIKVENFFPSIDEALDWGVKVIQTGTY